MNAEPAYSGRDFADLVHDAMILRAIENAHPLDPAADWPDPKPLPAELLPVAAFDLAMLPDTFRPWIEDIAERLQVPPEFAAVPAMIAAGSVIGNRIAIRPKRHDDWQETPNLWGLIIGRPGVLKSPAYGQAMRPLGRLAADATATWQDAK